MAGDVSVAAEPDPARAGPGEILDWPMDVTDDASVARAVAVAAALGSLTAVVNSAGVLRAAALLCAATAVRTLATASATGRNQPWSTIAIPATAGFTAGRGPRAGTCCGSFTARGCATQLDVEVVPRGYPFAFNFLLQFNEDAGD